MGLGLVVCTSLFSTDLPTTSLHAIGYLGCRLKYDTIRQYSNYYYCRRNVFEYLFKYAPSPPDTIGLMGKEKSFSNLYQNKPMENSVYTDPLLKLIRLDDVQKYLRSRFAVPPSDCLRFQLTRSNKKEFDNNSLVNTSLNTDIKVT